MLEILRSHLIALVSAYTAGTGVNAPSIGKLAVNDHNFFRRVERHQGFTVKSYDRVYTWFSNNWPDGAVWPEKVPYRLVGEAWQKSHVAAEPPAP